MNVVEHFHKAAQEHPNRWAIIHGADRISFAALQRRVIQTADAFQKKGLQKGDRVLVFVPMSVELYIDVLALFHMGAVAVFLDQWADRARLEVACELADCKAMIASRKVRWLSILSKPLRRIPIKLPVRNYGGKSEIEEVAPTDTALITFTTGSTGIPKAAVRTHGILNAQFDALIKVVEPGSGVGMTTLPIVLLIYLGSGQTSVIPTYDSRNPDSMDASVILDEVVEFKVDQIIASPFFVVELAKRRDPAKSKQKIKQVFTGGAPVFPHQAKMIDQGFPESDNVVVYGSTEAEPISHVSTKTLIQSSLNHGLEVGAPVSEARLKFIEISDDEVLELQETESIGEIVVAGDHVVETYFRNPEAVRENKIRVGDTVWHRTGDSGRLIDGKLFLTGRCQQLITANEQVLSPFIYEGLLSSIEGVLLGTVLDLGGPVVVYEGRADQDDVVECLSGAGLAFVEVRQYPGIPRDPRHHSKIDYPRLKALIS